MSGIPPIMDPSLVKIPLSGIYYSVLKKWESTRPAPEGHLSGPGYFTADLLWHRFLFAENFPLGGAHGPYNVGSGWHFTTILHGARNKIYATEGDGDLLWYHHRGHRNGTFRWSG